ncbi:MAG: NADH-quinone oxidoreductase subunit J [Planctomycetes bacterium]|nr:NADH-quinone oxidoreductase subunit J [Planctomycetota bacterium]
MPTLLVLLAGAVIVAAGIVTVTRRNPIHAALSMLVALGGVALLMLALHSTFLAAMQVLLYGGAIMVLFTFVIMLLTLREDEMGPEPPARTKTVAGAGAFFVLAIVWWAIATRDHHDFQAPALGGAFGSPEHFARFLYTDYVVSFELVTVLVMAAVAGVIVLGRRADRESLEGTRLTQAPAHKDPHAAPAGRDEVQP